MHLHPTYSRDPAVAHVTTQPPRTPQAGDSCLRVRDTPHTIAWVSVVPATSPLRRMRKEIQ
jgi:hypothetical protein